ncbi:hypothetical protein CROQUDRAFT_42795, partial [Cronartium quercuum f. sp. fusiforme G11]
LKGRLQMLVLPAISPLGTPTFSLHLKNIISQILSRVFFLQYDLHLINHVSQSKRWRETFAPDLQVPMVETKNGHFYIYEVVELCSGQKVVPCYFYQMENDVWAKCVRPTIELDHRSNKFCIKIPQEPAFDSNDLETIPVSKFLNPFEQIKVNEDIYLKHCSEEHMLCESIVSLAISTIKHQYF